MGQGYIYKLSKNDKCYIGSTKSPYVSIRMAHHREKHRKGLRNYQGLFDDGDPHVEICEMFYFPDDEVWKLRKREQIWMSKNRDNCINIRNSYISPTVKKENAKRRCKKYHQSEKGKLALRKAAINHKLKDQTLTGLKRSNLLEELDQINEKQNSLRASSSRTPEVPLALHQDQSA
jgi:hypothetical protein